MHKAPQIESLIIIDRGIDRITPFLSQVLYQGLLDDYMSIRGNIFELDGVTMQLCSERDPLDKRHGDQIFGMIRSLPISGVRNQIQQQVAEIKNFKNAFEEQKKKGMAAISWDDMKEFLEKSSEYDLQYTHMEQHLSIRDKIEVKMKEIYFYRNLVYEQEIIRLRKTQEETVEYC